MTETLKNHLFLSLIMENDILFRAIIEVLGKPKEHIEKSLKEYLDNLKNNKNYKVISQEIAEVKKQEGQELWVVFAELEVKTNQVDSLISFCFDYMPSVIEILEPQKLSLSDLEISQFLNDLQGKLHHVDMVAKQVKLENDYLKKNMGSLLRNYVLLLLSKQSLTSEQLSRLTGVDKDKLEDFLDQLIDKEKIDLKEGVYYLKEKPLTNKDENQ